MAEGFVHHRAGFALHNRTLLDTHHLLTALDAAGRDWPLDGLRVWVRYTRGTDYSGTCYLEQGRIYVNLGRHLAYPYAIITHVARTRAHRSGWVKPATMLTVDNAYQLAVFIFRHELYHWLVHRAGRNGRQKESMCDRFATRYAVDQWGCPLTDPDGAPIDRTVWDWQDLDRFVDAARRAPRRPGRPQPVAATSATTDRVVGTGPAASSLPVAANGQLLLPFS